MPKASSPLLYCIVLLILLAIGFYLFKNIGSDKEKMTTTPTSGFKTTPIHDAAKKGDLEECLTLISEGVNLDALNEQGWSPLIIAVMYDHVETAILLLEHGAKIQYSYQREDTPEERKKQQQEVGQMDALTNNKESMEELFKDVPKEIRDEILSDENMQEIQQDIVDMHFSASVENAIHHCQSLDMLKILVQKHNADINSVGEDGYWPLKLFAENDDLEIVQWLLENGADPDTTSTGSTAIYKAIANNNIDMVTLLIHHGAKTNILDVDGCTPFFSCESVPMAKLLLNHGADPTILDQADFPCWQFIDDEATKYFLKKEAQKRGLKAWTTLP